MSDLNNSVYRYYVDHFGELSVSKQFHFASRLYLWRRDTQANEFLQRLQPWFTAANPEQSLREAIEQAALSRHQEPFNASSKRQTFFDSYPLLLTADPLLFRLLFLKNIYDIDARNLLEQFAPAQKLKELRSKLLADDKALATLSTYAINFLYLYDRFICNDEHSLPIKHFYELGKDAYDVQDPVDLQLYIYLYTHCIIGETLFYYRPISNDALPYYRSMIADIETHLSTQYDYVSLDSKFEFLVACRICSITSPLEKRIYAEAEASVSSEGTFLVDVQNKFPQTGRTSLSSSEHRNVLYMMSHSGFMPIAS